MLWIPCVPASAAKTPAVKRLLSLLLLILVFIAASAAWYFSKLHSNNRSVKHAARMPGSAASENVQQHAVTASAYAVKNGFNNAVFFLVDMRIASGKPRFFVYNNQEKKTILEGLVTHGRCNENWLEGRKYGNEPGCGCTSLGKYKVGYPYHGRFGLAYKLYGLESTNSHAFDRFVVLHSMQCVPESAVDPYPICQSDGCPTVSPGFLKTIAPMIDKSEKPILLWIYQ